MEEEWKERRTIKLESNFIDEFLREYVEHNDDL